MRITTLLLTCVLGLMVGCGGKGKELAALESEACACKDAKCAKAVEEKVEKATEGMTEKDLSDENTKHMTAIAVCLMKIESAAKE